MWESFCPRRLATVVVAALSVVSCNSGLHEVSTPASEAEQAISEPMKQLYMAAAAKPPKSPEQQKIILSMAQKAANGKELLLVIRAAEGVFPSDAARDQVHSIVTAKMMQVATLNQMIEYARQYPVSADNARPYVERMFRLGEQTSDPGSWYRIRTVASHLKMDDMERQALAKADQLAGR